MNHLTKTNSKLSTQIHEVMPCCCSQFYTSGAGSMLGHGALRHIWGTGLTHAPGEARASLRLQLRNQDQSGSLSHSGLRLTPHPHFLLFLLFLQLEDNWEQEKKIRAEVEKARRKAESDLKMTIDNLNDMERSKLDLEEVVKKYAHAVLYSAHNNISSIKHFLDGARCQALC